MKAALLKQFVDQVLSSKDASELAQRLMKEGLDAVALAEWLRVPAKPKAKETLETVEASPEEPEVAIQPEEEEDRFPE